MPINKNAIFVLIPFLMFCGCATEYANGKTEDNLTETTINNNQPQSIETFAHWKQDFAQRSIAAGYAKNTVEQLLSFAQYQPQVVERDQSQAEFSKMPWEYLDSALSDNRIKLGQKAYASEKDLLLGLQQKYQLPATIITAIWGMESGYGGFMGKTDLISALATLAYDGRRRVFAENQLTAILVLNEEASISWSELQGSWAGGMGHTQFIPSTFLKYGVDGNHDGRRDPWVIADALSSTANYLQQAGWNPDYKWGYEVKLPGDFDYQYLHQNLTITMWQKLGLTILDSLPPGGEVRAKLWIPAGKNGPVFLLTSNFEVIKKYNNSSSYALAIGLLSDTIAGKDPTINQSWPRMTQALSANQIKNLQNKLNQQGFNAGNADGIVGTQTKQAFGQWQVKMHQTPDEFIHQVSAAGLLRD